MQYNRISKDRWRWTRQDRIGEEASKSEASTLTVVLELKEGGLPMRTLISWVAGALGFAAATFATTPSALSEEAPIVIGMAIAQTGDMSPFDVDPSNAVSMWVDERNAHGGLLGRQLKVITVDTKSDRPEGARAGQAVVDRGAELIFVTCDYDWGSPAAAVAQRAKKISVFLCAQDPKAGIQGIGPYAFTASIAVQVEGQASAEWAHKNLDANKVYSLVDTDSEYGKSMCAGWDWGVKNSGMQSLGSDTFRNDDPSVQSQITRISSLPVKPDALMLCTHIPGGASVIRQLRSAGLNMPIFSGAGMDGTYWLQAVPGLSDFYITTQASIYGDDPNPKIQNFVTKFKAKFGRAPVSALLIPAYVFMDLWASAVEKAGTTDPAKVVPIMEQYRDEPTISGPRTFTPELHIQDRAALQIIKYENGEPKDVGSYRIDAPVPYKLLFRLK
jgi:branched-chain amino acid transport system substrate-binding protein